MEIVEEKQGSVMVVSPVGRVDGVGAPHLEKRIADIIERGESRLVLDCAEMNYISSAGLRTVLIGARSCQQKGGGLAICALQPECRAVMEMSGFLQILKSYDTRDQAVAAHSEDGG